MRRFVKQGHLEKLLIANFANAPTVARFVVTALLVSLSACSTGPVRASNCEIITSAKYDTMLRAVLTNNTAKTVKYVGVLVGPQEYDFRVRIEPHHSTRLLVGPPWPVDPPNNARPLFQVKQNLRGPISDASCWARWVDFEDGSNWNVSPL